MKIKGRIAKLARVLNTIPFPDGYLEEGTYVLVEDDLRRAKCILSGKYQFRTIHNSHLKDIDFQEFIDRYHAVLADHTKSVKVADRLQDNVIQLQRELNEAKEALEAKKVALPKEVAEAITRLRAGQLTDIHIIRLSDMTSMLGKDYPKEEIDDLKTIRSYLFGDKLLSAFVNGYTIEEMPTTEEKIAAKLEEELAFHGIKCVSTSGLARNLTLALREVLAEDRQEV